jgi:Zn-dependent alcohol dehydrogenase
MSAQVPATAMQLRSLVTSEGELQLSLASVPVTAPGEDEVVVRVEASPINRRTCHHGANPRSCATNDGGPGGRINAGW